MRSHNRKAARRIRRAAAKKARTLSLFELGLTEVPDSAGQLTSLYGLYLSKNRLTVLPDWIGQLTSLVRLEAYENQLTFLPDSFGNLTQLAHLELWGNQLEYLPESIGNLTQLTHLDLNISRLTDLPDSIGNLTSLTCLNLGSSRLTQIPESIGNLTSLTELDLHSNELRVLPDSIGNLTSLTTLSLNSNKLTRLPDSIGQLTRLTRLNLRFNKLVALPDSLAQLNAKVVGAKALRQELLAPEPAPEPPGSALDAAKVRLQRRAEGRRLLARDPLLAREVGLGRPDLPGSDDFDLVDVNHASEQALWLLPGITEDVIRQIVKVRQDIGGFDSAEDLGDALHLPLAMVDEMAEAAVFVPAIRPD